MRDLETESIEEESGAEFINFFHANTAEHKIVLVKGICMLKSFKPVIILINIKMPTIVDILTFLSRINFMLS